MATDWICYTSMTTMLCEVQNNKHIFLKNKVVDSLWNWKWLNVSSFEDYGVNENVRKLSSCIYKNYQINWNKEKFYTYVHDYNVVWRYKNNKHIFLNKNNKVLLTCFLKKQSCSISLKWGNGWIFQVLGITIYFIIWEC